MAWLRILGLALLSCVGAGALAAIQQPPLSEVMQGLEQGCQNAEQGAHSMWSPSQTADLCHCVVQYARPELAKLHGLLGSGQGDIVAQAERVSQAMTESYDRCLGLPKVPLTPRVSVDPKTQAGKSAS